MTCLIHCPSILIDTFLPDGELKVNCLRLALNEGAFVLYILLLPRNISEVMQQI